MKVLRRSEFVRSTSLSASRFHVLLAVAAFAAAPTTARAETIFPDPAPSCIEEVAGETLNCTANDVGIAVAVAESPVIDGCDDGPNDTATFNLLADLQSTATERYDIGIYLALDAGNARTGNCSVSDLTVPPGSHLEGSQNDQCGDIASGALLDNVLVGEMITVPCVDEDNNGLLDISSCVSWDNQADDDCEGPLDTQPNTKAKCRCERITVTNIPVPPAECDEDLDCSDGDVCDGIEICVIPPGSPGDAFCQEGTPLVCENTDGNACTEAVCVEEVGCEERPGNPGAECRAAAGVCDVAEFCDGDSASCPVDTFEPASTECNPSAGDCDVAENCTGSSASCPTDGFVAASTECRAAAGDCDAAESCTGSSASCPADGFAAASTECRGANGDCDVAESCTGSSASCPADGFAAASTECRAANGDCDVAESCTGSSASCPADGFAAASTECRAAAGDCDAAESCTGSSASCPADGFAAASTECRGANGDCDAAESCTGSSASCPADGFAAASTECRGANGDCDAAESCTGNSASCPADGFAAASTECRGANGDCDVAESCTGSSASCPTDGFAAASTECRASGGVCDVAESCTGSGASCPADGFAAASTECRAAAGECDVAESCSGSAADCPADAKQGEEFVCRIVQGECDIEEVCDGVNNDCPADEKDLTCTPEICRTAGFWSTHGGTEKKGSKNITQTVLNAVDPGCATICGEIIDDTTVNSADSALEAMCVPVKGQIRLQLARQLTAAALNCIASEGSADCTGVSIKPAFDTCNAACTANADASAITGCVSQIDCFNNGGQWDGAKCIIGTCGGDLSENAVACAGNSDCTSLGNTCVAPTDTCHDQPLDSIYVGNLEPTGAAGSAKACQSASSSKCTVVGDGEINCTAGNPDENSETCNSGQFN